VFWLDDNLNEDEARHIPKLEQMASELIKQQHSWSGTISLWIWILLKAIRFLAWAFGQYPSWRGTLSWYSELEVVSRHFTKFNV
jgi:hypothetical protein